jgi:hypothetical protein
MEVSPQTRKQLLQTKLKIGWEICNVADYLVPKKCYKRNRYNYKHECKGEETCPHCTGKHKMKECTAAASEQKCINCITYNGYNKEGKVNENHSALSILAWITYTISKIREYSGQPKHKSAAFKYTYNTQNRQLTT